MLEITIAETKKWRAEALQLRIEFDIYNILF
jgi:hypothetical protein